MPLTMANIGETNTIKRVGGNEETRRFLANLGFVVDARSYSFICNRRQCDREYQGFQSRS